MDERFERFAVVVQLNPNEGRERFVVESVLEFDRYSPDGQNFLQPIKTKRVKVVLFSSKSAKFGLRRDYLSFEQVHSVMLPSHERRLTPVLNYLDTRYAV